MSGTRSDEDDDDAWMASIKHNLVARSAWIFERTWKRLEGLTDDEYFWEPAEGCWSVRPDSNGVYRQERTSPEPRPAPLTTIAWRMAHLSNLYGMDRTAQWLRLTPPATPFDDGRGVPSTAEGALDRLAAAHERWRRCLHEVDDHGLLRRMPKEAPRWTLWNGFAFVLVMIDEFSHHGAEVALLRDQYLWART